MDDDPLPSWRNTAAKHAVTEFVAAVTDAGSADFVAEVDRIAVFDNDGTLWTEQPMYAQLAFALDRAAELGHPVSLDKLHSGGMPALVDLVTLTHAGIATAEFDAVCRRWLASARHPRAGRPYPAMVYQPMLELLALLHRSGFSCWIFSGGGTDFMRAFASEVYDLPPHRVIGSVGGTSIHAHIGQRPILAAGNTDGDLAMLQWAAASPHRSLQLVVRHTDVEREYAYDRDPILGSGTGQLHAAATEHKWTLIDMAADWSAVYPPSP
jgi:hypothetical protein